MAPDDPALARPSTADGRLAPRGRAGRRPVDVTGDPTLLVANPLATVVDAPTGVWAIVGARDPAVPAAVEAGADVEAVRRRLVTDPGEGGFLHLDRDGVLWAFRGITSCHEVFYCLGSDGTPIVTDQFRNAVATLDVADRTVTDAIVADHLLYRTTPVGSYLDEVGRLGHGESLRWDPTAGEPEVTLAATLGVPPRLPLPTVVDRLDDALTASVDGLGDHRLMLSGGVDSSLLGTYEPRGADTVSAAFDSPELAVEIEYARRASRLLGSDHRVLMEPEDRFRERLEAAIDAAGMPLQLIQDPIQDAVFRHGGADVYENGQLSDSLFGMGARTAGLVWRTRWLRHLPPAGSKLETHHEIAARLARLPTDPSGYAAQTVQYLPQSQVARIVGRDRIDERQRARIEYVRARVPLRAPTADLAAHLEWGHWIEYFTENVATSRRQLAQSRGVALQFPFVGRAVAELALALPSPERYLDGFENKPVPKTLLGRRLPGYETSMPKQNGNLPVERYFRDGPLADVFERYPVPAFVPDRVARRLDRSPGLAWVLASYAIWRDRVLTNEDVTVVPGTRDVGL